MLKLRSVQRNKEKASETIAKFVALLINEKKGYEYVKIERNS